MTRTIRLTRIHALNWYGYQDTIPVEGNLLLAGVTGSGKTALMDLLQLVLIGDQRLLSFNKSATGDRSDRTLKGYCLGDTKEEENGVVQYMRQSAITYAALEFKWPNGKKVETWGIRVEFTSTAETQGKVLPFFAPMGFDRSDFLDSEKRPLDYTNFKALMEVRGGRTYTEGLESYLRDMAQPTHLNFERNVFRSLLPTAMSFTFLRSFNDFCRQFILPGDRLDVSNVTASYRTFLAYERDLQSLNNQLKRLQEISSIFTRTTQLRRDAALSRYLEAQFYVEHATELLAREEAEFLNLQEQYAVEEHRLKDLDEMVPDIQRRIKILNASINATPEGQLYTDLQSRRDQFSQRIGQLREVGSTLGDAFAHRIQRARVWLEELRSLPVEIDSRSAETVENAIRLAEQGGVQNADETLRSIADAAQSAASEASRAARPQVGRLAETRKRIAQLKTEIAALRIGRLPFPTRLLDALNSSLPRKGSVAAARHLCELCEVKDEFWRQAVEVAFTQKFAVVVAPEHYDAAERIYYGLSAADLGDQLGRESLVNPSKALRLGGTIKQGSLAEKIKASDPVAGAVVRHFFGSVMCVNLRENLREHDRAILPDGFMTRGAFVERRRFYDGMPFVGKRGLEQQLAWKEKELGELEAVERQLLPIETALRDLLDRWQERFEIAPSLYRDLARAKELPALESSLNEIVERLQTIDRAKFDQFAHDQLELERSLAPLIAEQRQLLQSPRKIRMRDAEDSVSVRRKELLSTTESFDRVRFETDVSSWLGSLENLRSGMLEKFPTKESAARKCGERFHNCDKEAAAAREELKAKRRELTIAHSKFEDLSVDVEDNAAYDKQLLKLSESDIPEYTEKSGRECKTWEGLFRTQVLEKLQTALREVRDQMFLLNTSLKQHPIGNNRYQLRSWNNPDFKIYHDLIEAGSLAREDELFFASAEPQFRDAIQHFLELLTDKPDSTEAIRLLDYRYYFEYDMEVIEEDGRKTSVDRHSGKFSGGENQSPYFIAILASYLRAYRRYSSRRNDPSLGLVPIDEAFSKLSGERIKDCINALKAFDLQGVFSMSTGNIPYALDHCDWLVAISKKESRIGKRIKISNIPVSISCGSDEARRLVRS